VTARSFAARIARWQAAHGRHDLPWQQSRDPYRIWVSEVMLQQTRVATVIPYYQRFMARFPDVHSLAGAHDDEVMALWSGLGYYARARNLLAAARAVEAGGGEFPATFDALLALPGIGRSTAAAISAFATGERRAILDGNVRRVLARHTGTAGDPSDAKVLADLWAVAESRLPARGIEGYTQGLMDLGATVCTVREPACVRCPVAVDCIAHVEKRWHELPAKRRRAKAQRRATHMLVVIDRGEVLLEKRPAAGIWGGLWSLPEAPDAQSVEKVAREWRLRPRTIEAVAAFEHAFTHFTLAITPWRVHARRPDTVPAQGVWLSLADLEGAALPSPVKQLLRREASAAAGTGAAPRAAAKRPSARAASASRRS
jgi:A/G-specific adenine glycosylase